MKHARLILLLAAISSLGFMCTRQFVTVKLLDGQMVQTISRETINFPGPGTDFVYFSEFICPKNVGEPDAGDCTKSGQAYGSSETLIEGLFSGAALGAFFPLIRPSRVNSSATGGSGDATAISESNARAKAAARAKGGSVTINNPPMMQMGGGGD